MEIVNLLWTGGLDSTFRLCELSRENVIVQPYYLIDDGRPSTKFEIGAMSDILALLRKKSSTKAELRDIKIFRASELQKDNVVEDAYAYLRQKYSLGSQYAFLAKFTRQHEITLEVGLENSPRSKASNALKAESTLVRRNIQNISLISGGMFVVEKASSTQPIFVVFGNLRMPAHLFTIEKIEEVRLLKEWGMEDVMRKTWFCHTPVMGYPCGHCHPCQDALNEGLRWRVPLIGRFLGSIRLICQTPLVIAKAPLIIARKIKRKL